MGIFKPWWVDKFPWARFIILMTTGVSLWLGLVLVLVELCRP